ncbi:MAG: efflux RND transporter permease subunit [Pirellulaceae bacterium]
MEAPSSSSLLAWIATSMRPFKMFAMQLPVLSIFSPEVDPPVVKKSDLDSSPVMTLAVSGPRKPSELFYLADRFVKGVIESSHGVGEVSIAGSADRAVQVRVDADRLAAYGLSILQVREALSRQNTGGIRRTRR